MLYNMFFTTVFGGFIRKLYLCIVFFMVLDLRLSKRLGCRDDNPSFLCKTHNENTISLEHVCQSLKSYLMHQGRENVSDRYYLGR